MARTKTSVEQAAKRAMYTLRDLEKSKVDDLQARFDDAVARRDAADQERESFAVARAEAFGRLVKMNEVIASLGWAEESVGEFHREDGTVLDSEHLAVGPFDGPARDVDDPGVRA